MNVHMKIVLKNVSTLLVVITVNVYLVTVEKTVIVSDQLYSGTSNSGTSDSRPSK